MAPELQHRDDVLAKLGSSICVGDVVVARHPYKASTLLIKVVASFDDTGRAYIVGINPKESTDSRMFGTLPPQLIIGRVTSRFER
jgi:nickel-type superoxide dismutase maturation protease